MRELSKRALGRLLPVAITALMLMPTLTGCNPDPTSASNAGTTSSTFNVDKLTSDLSLPSDQAQNVRAMFAQHGIGAPGAIWHVAADLQKSLTAEQKEKLLTMKPHDGPGGMRGPGMMPPGPDPLDSLRPQHGDMPGGPGHGGHGPDSLMEGCAPPSEADRAKDFDSMAAAVALTAEQKSEIEQLMETQRAAHDALMEKIMSGEIDPETVRTKMDELRTARDTALAQILDATQLEIVKIHDALMARMMPPPGPPPGFGGPGHPRGPHS